MLVEEFDAQSFSSLNHQTNFIINSHSHTKVDAKLPKHLIRAFIDYTFLVHHMHLGVIINHVLHHLDSFL